MKDPGWWYWHHVHSQGSKVTHDQLPNLDTVMYATQKKDGKLQAGKINNTYYVKISNPHLCTVILQHQK